MLDMGKEAAEANEFDAWLGSRSRWLQTSAAGLLKHKRMPNNDEVLELARLCKLEAAKKDDPGYCTVAPGSFAAATVGPTISIKEISGVSGVNALRVGASLPFGPAGLTVIYGPNGSGKSGYTRLLKEMCGSASRDEIHPNVFAVDDVPRSAKCQITVDGAEHEVVWQPASPPHSQLKHAQVFDTRAATHYMGKTEACYEPSSMRFITSLINIATAVAAVLERERGALRSALPQFPEALRDTPEQRWFSTLKSGVSAAKIEEFCSYNAAMDEERVATETLLAEKNVAGRLSQIAKEKLALDAVKTAMTVLEDGFSEEKGDALDSARKVARTARNTAQDLAQKIFVTSPLQGVGEPAWQQLWEQARKFSLEHAYPGQDYPVVADGAHCVLCQQRLSFDAAERLASFNSFMTAGLETSAKAAEGERDNLAKQIPVVPRIEDWIAHVAHIRFDEQTARGWHQLLQARRASLVDGTDKQNRPGFDWGPLFRALLTQLTDLENEKKGLSQLQQEGKRQQLAARVKTLQALQWLSQNKQSVLAEISRLKAVALFDKAITLTATNSLTTKRNDLAKSELEAGYQARFTEELRALGGTRLPVSPESKAGGKGKITFGIKLRGARGNHPPQAILSEGEARIVALAAFLADTTGSNRFAPFIFDDPISSLDQDFEERVAARLISLARSRQVVIFTHRLSLVALVEAAAKKHADVTGEKVPQQLQALRRMNKVAGILAKHSVRDTKPDKAVNVLRHEIIAQLRRLQESEDADGYDTAANNACCDFRIIIERTVEYVLLHDVVARFRRDVMTKGKLRGVAKITAADCELIDRLMTAYSVYEHSQSDELPQGAVELQIFEKDVNSLALWMDEFKERAA